MSNEINIEELERLAKAATPGPWKACGTVEQIGGDYKDIIPTSVSCMAYCYGGSADRAEDKDLIFIAAANPSAVISLIDRLKKAEAERDALAAELVELEGQEPTAWMNAKRDMASFIHFHEDDLPLFARPVPVEPVNVDFGMRGENMFFQIGNQSFLLDYKPEEQGEFEFMKAMLLSAFSRISHGVKTESQPVNVRLLNVSTGKLGHINAGLCPGSINGPDSRDPACPACRAIAEADADSKLENFMLKFGEADFPAGYCLDPNGKMSVPFGREEDFNFGYEIGFREAWEITNSAIRAAVKPPTQQQERLLQDMHDAGREIDLAMAEPAQKAVRLTHADIAKALASAGLKPEDYREDGEILPLVVAIEAAALRKNGIEVAE